MKKTLRYTALILGALFVIFGLTATAAVTLGGKNRLLPEIFGLQAGVVSGNAMPDLLPDGTLVLLRDEAMEAGHVALLENGAPVVMDKNNALLSPDSAESHDVTEARGRIVYRVVLLGSLLTALKSSLPLAWGLWALLFMAAAAFVLTLPRRRRKKEVQELIALFDYYGRKYDAEEEGIDY